jgi:hypothetical protein
MGRAKLRPSRAPGVPANLGDPDLAAGEQASGGSVVACVEQDAGLSVRLLVAGNCLSYRPSPRITSAGALSVGDRENDVVREVLAGRRQGAAPVRDVDMGLASDARSRM